MSLRRWPMPMSPAPCSRMASSKPVKMALVRPWAGCRPPSSLSASQAWKTKTSKRPSTLSATAKVRKNTGSRDRLTKVSYRRVTACLRAADSLSKFNIEAFPGRGGVLPPDGRDDSTSYPVKVELGSSHEVCRCFLCPAGRRHRFDRLRTGDQPARLSPRPFHRILDQDRHRHQDHGAGAAGLCLHHRHLQQ